MPLYQGRVSCKYPLTRYIKKKKLRINSVLEDVGGSPWAGSLRHVKERAKKSSKKEDNDLYGAAPWMGTLRCRFFLSFCAIPLFSAVLQQKKCIKKLIEGVSCKNIDIDRYCIF